MDTCAASIVCTEIRKHLQTLEVDSSHHRTRKGTPNGEQEENTHEEKLDATTVVTRYEEALQQLQKELEHLPDIRRDPMQHDDQWSTLKDIIPTLTLNLTAHMGNHYWTSTTSRQLAKGAFSQVLSLSGCRSPLELLIGQDESHDRQTQSHDYRVTSPYIPIATTATTTTTTATTTTTEQTSSQESTDNNQWIDDEGDKKELAFSNGIIKLLLSLLRSRLTKDNWKRQPCAKHCLVWTVSRLKHPHLSPHLPSFLPPILMMLDDHETYHKTLGVSLLLHIIQNIDASELRQYGRAEVIYEVIKTMQYVREIPVIHSLHNCLILLLPILEGPKPITVTAPRKPTITDEVFRILLNNVDFESKIALRKAYISHVSSYVELLGIYTARHIKNSCSILEALYYMNNKEQAAFDPPTQSTINQILKVVQECMLYPDYSGEHTRQSALETLIVVMKHTWPRVPYHKDVILKMLLKLVSDLCPEDHHIPNKPEIHQQLKLIVECMATLQHCCGNIKELYMSLQRKCDHRGLQYCLESILTNMEPEHSTTNIL